MICCSDLPLLLDLDPNVDLFFKTSGCSACVGVTGFQISAFLESDDSLVHVIANPPHPQKTSPKY